MYPYSGGWALPNTTVHHVQALPFSTVYVSDLSEPHVMPNDEETLSEPNIWKGVDISRPSACVDTISNESYEAVVTS